ncbi:MAG TPA: cyclopropane-fatty-acyl-phospholipid synthase family protein [Longimicrobiales bacterium]|nr:cyclopropane-fatty-acyl-phospholipid synthase family protein [Longimicrobiales bacterium]
MSLLERLARRAVHGRLERLREGRLTLVEGGRARVFGSGGEPSATVSVRDPGFFTAVALGGHVGAAESYVERGWDTDDLTAVVRVLVRNRDVLDGLEKGLARLARPARTLLHARNRNTRRGSRRNILAHYDLGNDFFAEFLDETMTYSCGIFSSPECSMRAASIRKYDRLCRKLELGPGDRVIEIGTGWGGFALHAASTYGCRVTTTTISERQHALASRRVEEAGLSGRVQVLRRDYRDLRGRFDKLVSIEMIEAVGHQYFGRYFRTCADLLEPHGLAAIQAITIQDRFYESARREVDFIKRYIFPGSCIPSLSVLAAATAPTDLRLVALEDITRHYGETLRRWRRRFESNWARIRSLGYPEELRRLWRFYFCYCEGGFDEAAIGNVQLLFAKPRAVAALAAADALGSRRRLWAEAS